MENNTLVKTIEELIEAVGQEARRQEFPIDIPAYERVHKDPYRPILFAGSLEAPVCVFGRDLGKDEVGWGQPLIGAGGTLVRAGILRSWQPEVAEPTRSPAALEDALKYALLTNTVPFKPPGNKAYAESVRNRFRPYLVQLLTRFWRGRHVITLGTEAFRWFEPYGQAQEFQALGTTDARFEAVFTCRIPRSKSPAGDADFKVLSIRPLPHPSPLNRRWFSQFPSMLAQRLTEIRRATAEPAE